MEKLSATRRHLNKLVVGRERELDFMLIALLQEAQSAGLGREPHETVKEWMSRMG
jgi:hypothetical protein